MIKEHHFLIREDTPPDFETEVGKWWLCDKGQKYDIWRFDSKKKDYQAYLLLRRSDSEIVAEEHRIEDVATKQDIYDQFY